jgi:hypothetical protein
MDKEGITLNGGLHNDGEGDDSPVNAPIFIVHPGGEKT